MKQEDKELLLKELCARLPYGVYVKDIMHRTKICGIYGIEPSHVYCLTLIPISDSYIYQAYSTNIDSVRPYLRPMNSITEEEKEEIKPFFSELIDDDDLGRRVLVVRQNKMALYQDWLNAHHFDYRGLIKKGLAIAVTEDNNPYENNH